MIDILLFLSLIALEFIHYFERKKLISALTDKKEATIPKARQSFVVRNMKEKLKEAMFPQDDKN